MKIAFADTSKEHQMQLVKVLPPRSTVLSIPRIWQYGSGWGSCDTPWTMQRLAYIALGDRLAS